MTFLAMAAGAFPVYAMSALGPVLIERLDIDRAGVGTLTALVFVGAAVTSATIGRLTDRAGARRALVAAMGLALVLAGTATQLPGYGALVAWALAAGPLLATGNPVCNRLIAGLRSGERGVVMGVKQAGVQASTVAAGLVAPPLALAYGWRSALMAGAVLPLAVLAALPTLSLDRAHPRPGPSMPIPDRTGDAVRLLQAYAFLMGAGVACVLAFLPVYATDTRVLSPVGAGALLSTAGANGAVARVVLGREVERSGAFSARLAVLGAVGACGIALLVVGGGVPGPRWVAVAALIAAAVVLGWSAISWNAIAMLYVVVHAGQHDAGTASGRVLVGFYAGVAATPTLFGWLVESGLPYPVAWGAVALLFLLAARTGMRLPPPQQQPNLDIRYSID